MRQTLLRSSSRKVTQNNVWRVTDQRASDKTDDVIDSRWGWVQVTPHRGPVCGAKTPVLWDVVLASSFLLLVSSVAYILPFYWSVLIPRVSHFPSLVFLSICHRSRLTLETHRRHSLQLLLHNRT